jgi:hypothetical protein
MVEIKSELKDLSRLGYYQVLRERGDYDYDYLIIIADGCKVNGEYCIVIGKRNTISGRHNLYCGPATVTAGAVATIRRVAQANSNLTGNENLKHVFQEAIKWATDRRETPPPPPPKKERVKNMGKENAEKVHSIPWPSAKSTCKTCTESRPVVPMCVVCTENRPAVVFLPCAHLVTCGECCQPLVSCPMCRAKVIEFVPVFYS